LDLENGGGKPPLKIRCENKIIKQQQKQVLGTCIPTRWRASIAGESPALCKI